MMTERILRWIELPELPPPGRTVLVHCPSDIEKVATGFYSEDGCWYGCRNVGAVGVLKHEVMHWAEVPLP